ncbi:MAG: OsmC family protein [candidate division WOR-3 bacterium]
MNMQKVTLKWIDNLRFVVTDENKHSMILDTKSEVGGTETGFQPIDMILISLGGCMAFDIVSILQKKRAGLKEMIVTVEGERAEEHPKRYTTIKVKIQVNQEIKEEDLQRAFELSRDKYCSAAATLKVPPEVKYELQIGETQKKL